MKPNAHPLVKRAAILLRTEGISRNQAARTAGIAEHTPREWWAGGTPNLANFEAFIGALGYALKIVPRQDAPAPLREGPLLFVVAGILRDNAPKRWTAHEVRARLQADGCLWTARAITNALGSLRRAKRIEFNGSSYAAIPENERCDF